MTSPREQFISAAVFFLCLCPHYLLRDLKAILEGQLLPAVLSGALGVRLSFTLAVHLCRGGGRGDCQEQNISKISSSSSMPTGQRIQKLLGRGERGEKIADQDSQPLLGLDARYSSHLLFAYPRELVHFILLGSFASKAPLTAAGLQGAGGASKGQ